MSSRIHIHGQTRKSFKGFIVSPVSAVHGEPVPGTASGIEPSIDGEFQPQLETAHPGGGAHLFPYYILFSN
jgi:hypothetical protein